MEPITIISTAFAIVAPFLTKTGEKIAGKMGEDVWEWIKKPFSEEEKKELLSDLDKEENVDVLKAALIKKMEADPEFKNGFTEVVNAVQGSPSQQNIKNEKDVGKQINITNNSGNIQM